MSNPPKEKSGLRSNPPTHRLYDRLGLNMSMKTINTIIIVLIVLIVAAIIVGMLL